MQKRTRRTVFIPDLRNHGLSPHHESHTYFDMASDIERLCADRGLNDVTLVAHSMGARAAMLLCLLGISGCFTPGFRLNKSENIIKLETTS